MPTLRARLQGVVMKSLQDMMEEELQARCQQNNKHDLVGPRDYEVARQMLALWLVDQFVNNTDWR
jgi:hypothetical protein